MTWGHKVAGESRWRQGRTDFCLAAAPLLQVFFLQLRGERKKRDPPRCGPGGSSDSTVD
jgi:hypothetical protein